MPASRLSETENTTQNYARLAAVNRTRIRLCFRKRRRETFLENGNCDDLASISRGILVRLFNGSIIRSMMGDNRKKRVVIRGGYETWISPRFAGMAETSIAKRSATGVLLGWLED